MDALTVVYKTAGLTEAEIIKGLLESEEIPVHLQYESAGAVYGLTVDGLGEVKICVPEAFAEEARELLRPLDTTRLDRFSPAGLRDFVRRARSGETEEPPDPPEPTGGDREADPAA